MMSRRFLNLAMTDCSNYMFSLHRLDVAKLLFYPSTDEAEAHSHAGKAKPSKIGQLRRLPPPIMCFEPFPTRDRDPLPLSADRNMFVLLHGPRGRSSSEASRIFFSNAEGQATMYDAESRSVVSVPDLSTPTESRDDMPKHIVTGAGAGEERLYVMRAGGQFEVLDLSDGDKSPTSFWTNRTRLQWQRLPPLPVVEAMIWSFTVVDCGRIICVSFAGSDGDCTFCFDTVSQEWWKAGDWVLPFYGRAEYVPELNTWLGFSSCHPHHLCAADLSGVAMAPRQAPTLQHVWEDFNPPSSSRQVLYNDYPGICLTKSLYWSISQLCLVNLGSGRFCVAKVAHGEEYVSVSWSVESHEGPEDTLAVLTGVEVIRGGGDGEELRMVKHKSRELMHPGLDMACML